MKKLLKILGFSVLGSIVFFVIVGILINIFVPEEELEEMSLRNEERRQERAEARKQAEQEKIAKEKAAEQERLAQEKAAEELAKEKARLEKEAAEQEKAAKEAERKRKRQEELKARIEEMKKDTSYWVTPYTLIKDYDTNPFAADAKYRGKIVQVTGTLRDFGDGATLLLASGNLPQTITCSISSGALGLLRKGHKIELVGRIDYDTKVGNIKLWDCHILSPSRTVEKTR